MQILGQRNPLWSSVKLGASDVDVAHYGCTTVCLSMLSDYFKCYVSPSLLAHNAHNYNAKGEVLWNNLKFDKMQFLWRAYGVLGPGHVSPYKDDKRILEALKDPKQAVLLQVDNGKHWVVALRKTLIGNDYLVADPYYATKNTARGTWHNITGAAYFKAK